MLAIARALVARPALLMLDEPSLGLAPLLVRQIFGVVAELKREGVTIVLVEQNARQALAVADRAYILETGQVVLAARPPSSPPAKPCNAPTWEGRVRRPPRRARPD